ncbi:MAG: hypothetical protein RI897_3160 [Verrucomicrobiota bacterium]|jgi:hypothetical protein
MEAYKGVWAWICSIAAAVLVYLGMGYLAVGWPGDGVGRILALTWPEGVLRVCMTLLVAHVVFWWREVDKPAVISLVYGFLAGLCFFLLFQGVEAWVGGGVSLWGRGSVDEAGLAWSAFQEAPWVGGWRGVLEGEDGVWQGVLRVEAVPLVAVIAKVLMGLGFEVSVNPVWWVGLGVVLQGVFAVLLMRCLSLDARIQMVGVGLFMLSPVWLNALGYVGSGSHWVLLAGLWLYFRTVGTERRGLVWVAWLALGFLSVWIHGQLALMVGLLGLAYVVRIVWVDGTEGLGFGLGKAMLLVGVMVAGFFLAGYRDWGCVVGAVGGEVGVSGAMNMAGPFDPSGWSSLLKDWEGVDAGSGVGFGYWGAGVIVLMLWCWLMMVLRPLDSSGFRPWIPVVFLGVVLAVVSVMPRIGVGQYLLVDWSGREGVLGGGGLFAGTGRYFWLMHYGVLFLLIALVVHGLPGRRAVLLLALVFTIQAVDLRERLGEQGRVGPVPVRLDAGVGSAVDVPGTDSE